MKFHLYIIFIKDKKTLSLDYEILEFKTQEMMQGNKKIIIFLREWVYPLGCLMECQITNRKLSLTTFASCSLKSKDIVHCPYHITVKIHLFYSNIKSFSVSVSVMVPNLRSVMNSFMTINTGLCTYSQQTLGSWTDF